MYRHVAIYACRLALMCMRFNVHEFQTIQSIEWWCSGGYAAWGVCMWGMQHGVCSMWGMHVGYAAWGVCVWGMEVVVITCHTVPAYTTCIPPTLVILITCHTVTNIHKYIGVL